MWEDKYCGGDLRTFSFYCFCPLLNGKHCYDLRIRIGHSVQGERSRSEIAIQEYESLYCSGPAVCLWAALRNSFINGQTLEVWLVNEIFCFSPSCLGGYSNTGRKFSPQILQNLKFILRSITMCREFFKRIYGSIRDKYTM